MRHLTVTLLFALITLVLVSCSKSGVTLQTFDSTRSNSFASSDFKIIDLSGLDSADKYRLETTDAGDVVNLRVVTTVKNAEGHLLHIEYPSSELTPLKVIIRQNESRKDITDLLTLSITRIPGFVAVGAVPIKSAKLPDDLSIHIDFERAPFVNRVISKAPSGEENIIDDLEVRQGDVDFVLLEWHGKLAGDYDYSGEVGVSDITPIANYYLADPTDGQGDEILEAWIDGDGNVEVGISDISVIAQHYLESLVGYYIYYGTPLDPGNPESDVDWGTTPLETGENPNDPYLVEAVPGVRGMDNGFYQVVMGIDAPIEVLETDSAWRIVPTDGETEGVPGETVFLSPNADTDPPIWINDISIISAVPGDEQVTVTWGTAEDALSPPVVYHVYYDESATFDFSTAIDSGPYSESIHEAVITGLTNGVEYTFGVRATDMDFMNNNEDQNTNTLDATPFAPISSIAKVPPSGTTRVGTENVYNSDIAIGPGFGNSSAFIENGAPLIVYRTESNSLKIAWYNAGWQEEVVVSNAGLLVAPQIAIIHGQAVILVFNRDQSSAKVFVGIPTLGFDEYEISPNLGGVPFAARISYLESESKLVVAYSLEAALSPARVCVFTAPYLEPSPAAITGTTEVIDNDEVNILGLDLAVNQNNGEISIVYSAGEIDQANMIFDTKLNRALKSGAAPWSVNDLTTTISGSGPLSLSADYVGGDMQITYQNVRIITIPIVGYQIPVFDVSVYRSGTTPLNKTIFSGQFSVNIFTQRASLNYGLESCIVPTTSSNAFIAMLRAAGDLGVSGFPNITGSVEMSQQGTVQTSLSSNPVNWQAYGLGNSRNFSGAFDANRSRVNAAFIATSALDIGALADLSNLPPGPLNFITIVP